MTILVFYKTDILASFTQRYLCRDARMMDTTYMKINIVYNDHMTILITIQ